MKKYIFLLAIFSFLLIGQVAYASVIFSEDFGTGSTNSGMSSLGWSEGGNGGDDAEMRSSGSGNDTASPDGGRFGVMLGESGYICRTINTTGYTDVNLSYYWRGDDDADSVSDNALVEFKPTGSGVSCSNTTGWTTLADHDMRNDGSWTSQSPISNSSLNNSSFLIKFRVSTTANDEHFRVDKILISGTSTADQDGDGIYDSSDNCPSSANAEQTDTDNDGVGDTCDETPNGTGGDDDGDDGDDDSTKEVIDTDNDGVEDSIDNCPSLANSDQTDTDEDGIGNSCDSTSGGDNSDDESDITSGSRVSRSSSGSRPQGEVLGAEKFVFTLFLKRGLPFSQARFDEIKELQKRLKSEGYYFGLIDGYFGSWTEDAVRAYQFAHPPLKVDGIVGPKTRAVLNS